MRKRRKSAGICLLLCLVLLLAGCVKTPLRIGMIGSLSSKQSQLSIDARNAIELGVEQINMVGGINGRPIELVVKDDQDSLEVAQKCYQEFLDDDVHLILGHMTSSMTDAVFSAEQLPLLFISPSMSLDRLSDRDDNFFRTSPLASAQASEFVEFAQRKGYKSLTIAYDLTNREYTELVAKRIERLVEEAEIMTVDLIPYHAQTDNLKDVAEAIIKGKSESVLMIAQATDTAFLSQKVKQYNPKVELTSVSWSMTQDLITFGGKAVEDMYFIGLYRSDEKSQDYQAFKQAFQERYHYEPSFVSVLAYDTLMVLAEGVQKAESSSLEDVKAAILSIQNFQGLEEAFSIDAFGDSDKGYSLYQLRGDTFMRVE